jgi:uncharacterized protein (DUF1330 family)
MAVCLVADIDVHDPETDADCGRPAPATRAGHGDMSCIIGGGAAAVLEGGWQPKKSFVSRFEDRDQAMAWYGSPEYQEAMKIRLRSSTAKLAENEVLKGDVTPGPECRQADSGAVGR